MEKPIKKPYNTEYVEREPIVINDHAVALIHIFKKYDEIEDMWMFDTEYMCRENKYEKAAKQFISQLCGQTCDAFNTELIIELIKYLKKCRSRCSDQPDAYLKHSINRIKEVLSDEPKITKVSELVNSFKINPTFDIVPHFKLTKEYDKDVKDFDICFNCGDNMNAYKLASTAWTSVQYCVNCNHLNVVYHQDRMGGTYEDVIRCFTDND